MCGHNVFICGKAGTGKHVIKYLYLVKLMERQKAVACGSHSVCGYADRLLHFVKYYKELNLDAFIHSVASQTRVYVKNWPTTRLAFTNRKTFEAIYHDLLKRK